MNDRDYTYVSYKGKCDGGQGYINCPQNPFLPRYIPLFITSTRDPERERFLHYVENLEKEGVSIVYFDKGDRVVKDKNNKSNVLTLNEVTFYLFTFAKIKADIVINSISLALIEKKDYCCVEYDFGKKLKIMFFMKGK